MRKLRMPQIANEVLAATRAGGPNVRAAQLLRTRMASIRRELGAEGSALSSQDREARNRELDELREQRQGAMDAAQREVDDFNATHSRVKITGSLRPRHSPPTSARGSD